MSAEHETDAEAQTRLLEPLSTKWIENASGASRDTVAAWRKGRVPRADQWERFLEVLTQWQLRIPDAKEPAPSLEGTGRADEIATEVTRLLDDRLLSIEDALAALRVDQRIADREQIDEETGQSDDAAAV